MSIALARLLIWPFVALLLATSGPATICFAIATIVFMAIKRFSKRAFTHIGKEVFEIQPARVFDTDAASAIVLPTRLIGIGAAVDHALPTAIGKRFLLPLGVAVRQTGFASPATARLGIAAAKMFCKNDSFIATIADAAGLGLPRMRSRHDFKHSQEMKFLAFHRRNTNISPLKVNTRIEALEAAQPAP